MAYLSEAVSNKLSHLVGAGLGLLAFFSTDPTFLAKLSDNEKWWLHIVVSAAIYLGVVVAPTGGKSGN